MGEMAVDNYSIIDITSWDYENITVSGSKEKRWYRSKSNNKLALFKLPISLTSESTGRVSDSTGEPWSEKICSELGELLGFSTHCVDIASLTVSDEDIDYYGLNKDNIKAGDQVIGALCWSFLNEKNESLIEGADMIMDFDETYNRDELKGEVEIYNFDLLYRLFTANNILDELFKMIVFDTLIGNTDRHQDNFGVIRNEKDGRKVFSPLYDNSSSLGRELTEHRIELMLRDSRMFNSYLFGNKSSTLIRWDFQWKKKKLNIFEFYNNVKNMYPEEIADSLNAVKGLTDDDIESVVSRVPSLVMSDLKKEFVVKIIKARKNYLTE